MPFNLFIYNSKMSRTDKLKERLIPFIKESESETLIEIPNRIMITFKLENVAVIIQDLLCDKYHKKFQLVEYRETSLKDGYIFEFSSN